MRIVRPFALMVAVLGVGIGSGCNSKVPAPPSTDSGKAPVASTTTGKPHLVIGTYDGKLGDTDFDETRSRTIRVSNDGTAPLQFLDAEKTCACMEVDLPRQPLAPGASDNIVIRWTPRLGLETGRELTLTVKLKTSETADRVVPRLDLTGRIVPLVMLVPWEQTAINLGKIRSGGNNRDGKVKLVSSRLDSFKIDTKLNQPWFTAEAKPLENDELDGMKCGYRVIVKPTQSLGQGNLRDTLTMTFTNPATGKKWDMKLNIDAEVEQGIFEIRQQIKGVWVPMKLIRFQKKSVLEEDVVSIRVQFLNANKDAVLKIEKCDLPFVVCSAPRPVGEKDKGLWEFTAKLLGKNDAAMKKIQAEGSFEGRIYFSTPQSPSSPIPVVVKWDSTGP